MKQPVVDYRKFRLSKLNDPEFSHLKLLLGWIFYFTMYFITENLIPPEACHPMHCALDDLIPFCELFLIPYVFWYLLIVGSLLYFLLYNPTGFRRLQTYILLTQIIAMAVYIIYPSRQDLRPEVFPRENILTWLLGIIYRFDTSTGVCPSLHVAYSMGIASTWLREKGVSPWFKALIVALAILISIATTFVKQHSAVDVFWALPMCLVVELIVFRREWKQVLFKNKHTEQS